MGVAGTDAPHWAANPTQESDCRRLDEVRQERLRRVSSPLRPPPSRRPGLRFRAEPPPLALRRVNAGPRVRGPARDVVDACALAIDVPLDATLAGISVRRSLECCFADCLITDFPDYFARWVRGFPTVFGDRRKGGRLAGCRTAVGASSRFAAPALRSGPSGDPPPSARRSASMAVSAAFGHGPIARRIVVAGA